jgi:protein O-mannosyl-transferase
MGQAGKKKTTEIGRPVSLALGAVVVLSIALAYSNSLGGVFVFDDNVRILRNPAVQEPELGRNQLRGLFLFARPLADLTLRINFQAGGPNPRGFHLFNIAVHIFAALVLMGFARRCLHLAGADERQSLAAGFSLALLWSLHPLQTQAVTYIFQRAESLAGLFFLLTMYCAGRGLSETGELRKRKWWLAGSVAACATGHLVKQTLFAAPLAVMVFDYCFIGGKLREILKRSYLYYICLSLTWLIGAGLILATKMDDTVGYSIKNVTAPGYLFSQPGVILHYLRLSIWPDALLLNYNWPVAKTAWAILPHLLAILALLASVAYSLTRPERHWRFQGFVGAWFFITLAMSSSFFPIRDLAVEHRMYLALASVAALFLWILWMLLPSARIRHAVVLAAALVLGVRTYIRNDDYNSQYKIWSGVLKKVPNDPRALNELGNAYRDDARFIEALALYTDAIRFDPENPGPHLNAGLAHLRLDNFQAAERHFSEALRLRPAYPEAHLDLGNALAAQKRWEEALTQYDIAIRQKPDFFEPLAARANTLCLLNRFDEALDSYREAIRRQPGRYEIYSDIGTAYFSMGKFEDALGFYLEALRRQPDSAPVHLSTAETLRRLGRDEQARTHETRAKELMRPTP